MSPARIARPGSRGNRHVRPSMRDVLLAMSRLGANAGRTIGEAEIDPMIVLPQALGTVAVDASVICSEA